MRYGSSYQISSDPAPTRSQPIGFTVELRAREDRRDDPPSSGSASSNPEPTLEMVVTIKPPISAELPTREEIIGCMVADGYSFSTQERSTSDQDIRTDSEGNITQVRTTSVKPREDSEEMFCCGRIWARWPEAAKNARIALNESTTWRTFFAACVVAVVADNAVAPKVIEALKSVDGMRQFAGDAFAHRWLKENDPRAHVLRKLVSEERDNFRKMRA